MKCIYLVDVFKGKRCGKKAFGLFGGNSYCEKHLTVKEKPEPPRQAYHRPIYKSEIEQFHEMHGRAPNRYELIAMM